ncbi:hypothetical protein NEA10_18475 [Phormidium yuhuli AB48]|uniref:Uncharacterized protein n=1 Tax=Phormidium yuhuli AB48 TaxID=2940671 RepID=A0ABY5APC0_9CYAN|nr:hypothetical protein [Phormidium yuhuli]USR90781.1 hypothetical protein NEA10_18475 [Phormidium yuhuli AB48]
MERSRLLDCQFECIISITLTLAIAILTVWGYLQDSSLYVEVRSDDETALITVDSP